MNRPIIIAVAVISLLAAPSFAQTTRLVPSQYPTIQTAIAASVNGDTVLVSPGVYPGAINLLGKALNVQSSGGAAVTTIVGAPGANVVTFASSESSTCVLNGFSVTGGSGVFIQNSSPTIQNCRIFNNARSGLGGGILCATTGAGTASPTITGCSITNNLTIGFGGAGVAFDGQSSATSFPTINNCVVSSNFPSSGTSGQGGGMALYGKFTAAFIGCRFENNSTSNVGGAAYVDVASASFTSCHFLGNHAGGSGGALFVNGGSLSLTACLIADNSCEQTGGVLYMGTSNYQPPVSLLIKNCTMTGNSAAQANGGVGVFGSGSPTLTISNTILWGNSGTDIEASTASVTYSDVGFGLYTPGVGAISTDPVFVDPANGDYHLTTVSPCRNAGAPGTVGLPPTDLDGGARIVGAAVDMGSDEVPALAYPGTADGLDLYARVNGSGDPLASSRPAAAGDLLSVTMKSATGLLTGGLPVLAVELFTTGSPPTAPFPGVWLDAQAMIVFGTLSAPPFGFPGLPPEGLTFSFTVPSGLAGMTVRLQGATTSLNALNGVYATSNATEVTF